LVKFHINEKDDWRIEECENVSQCKAIFPKRHHYKSYAIAENNAPWFTRVRFSVRAAGIEAPAAIKHQIKRYVSNRSFVSDEDLELEWIKSVRHFGGVCYLCGKALFNQKTGDPLSKARDLQPTIDHIYPLALGGGLTPGNIAPAHRVCNIRRADIPIEEYLADNEPMLSRVYSLRKKTKYTPPSPEKLKIFNEGLQEIWETFDAQVKELAQKLKE